VTVGGNKIDLEFSRAFRSVLRGFAHEGTAESRREELALRTASRMDYDWRRSDPTALLMAPRSYFTFASRANRTSSQYGGV
jgi:hypothetical protein